MATSALFHTWLLPTSTFSYFWSYYNWFNAVMIDFLRSWSNTLKKYVLTIILFYFLCVMACLSLTLCKKTLKPSQKNVSMPRMDERKLHTQEFQLKGSDRNMRCNFYFKKLHDPPNKIHPQQCKSPTKIKISEPPPLPLSKDLNFYLTSPPSSTWS